MTDGNQKFDTEVGRGNPVLNRNLRGVVKKLDDLFSSFTNFFNTKNVANGWLGLNGSGLVDAQFLPSYVDDVLEFNTLSVFPTTGETGKIYLDKSTNLIYRWSGSTYTLIGGDLSAYQATNAKDQANGYLGADSTGGLNPSKITQTSLYRLVTDTLINAWNNKQDALSFINGKINPNLIDLSGIDLSAYQATSAKNQANGYMGLDSYGKNSDPAKNFSHDSLYIGFNWLHGISSYQVVFQQGSAQVGFDTNGTAFSRIKSTDNTLVACPRLYFGGNIFGYGTHALGTMYYELYSPHKITTEWVVAWQQYSFTKQARWIFGIGNYTITTYSNPSDGIFICIDPTINGGKFVINKAISGTVTSVNTTIGITLNEKTYITQELDLLNNTAKFWVNGVQVGSTISNVNLTINQFRSLISAQSGDSSEANVRPLAVLGAYLKID